jgi:hypothetical protein
VTAVEYYEYYAAPFRLEETANGGLRGFRLNRWTGEFELTNSKIENIMFAREEEIFRESFAEYVRLAEELRSDHLRGDTGVLAIYEVIEDILARGRAKGAGNMKSELALVMSLRYQTFDLWEREFARRAAGEAPSFIYTSVAGELDDLRHVDPTPDIDPETVARWNRQLGPIRAAYDAALLKSESRAAHEEKQACTPFVGRPPGSAVLSACHYGSAQMTVVGYYEYYGDPFRLEETAGGGLRGFRMNQWTGEFELANSRIERTMFAREEEIFTETFATYVELAEKERAYNLKGEAEVFDIYRKIDAVLERARAKDSDDVDPELALVMSLRYQTFDLWEREFARRAAGEAPSFTYTSVAGELDDLRHVDPTPDIDPETVARWNRQLGPIRAAYDAALLESESRVADDDK